MFQTNLFFLKHILSKKCFVKLLLIFLGLLINDVKKFEILISKVSNGAYFEVKCLFFVKIVLAFNKISKKTCFLYCNGNKNQKRCLYTKLKFW